MRHGAKLEPRLVMQSKFDVDIGARTVVADDLQSTALARQAGDDLAQGANTRDIPELRGDSSIRMSGALSSA